MAYAMRASPARPAIERFGSSSRSYTQNGMSGAPGSGLEDEGVKVEDEGDTVGLLPMAYYRPQPSLLAIPAVARCMQG